MRGWRGGGARGRRVENSGGGRGRGWRGGSVAFGRRLARNRREIRKRVAGPRGRLRRRKFLRAPLFEILFASLLALLARRRLGCLFGRGRRGRNDLRGWRRGNAARRQQRLHRVRESGLQRNAAFRRDLEAEAHTHLVLLPRLLYCRRLRLRYSNCLCRLRLCRQECLCHRCLPRRLRLRRLRLSHPECLRCRRMPCCLRLCRLHLSHSECLRRRCLPHRLYFRRLRLSYSKRFSRHRRLLLCCHLCQLSRCRLRHLPRSGLCHVSCCHLRLLLRCRCYRHRHCSVRLCSLRGPSRRRRRA